MDRRLPWQHLLPALALAGVLSAAWTAADWSNLAALRLPDTDDAMRLQQVRDWLAGQAFGDVSQHRLAGGLPMHWSRIGDLVPAAIITLLRPLIGQSSAEITAVIAWPFIQFVALLTLIRNIAARLAPAGASAALILAALAYPTVSLFMLGRIDHHALQVLLVLVQARALLAVPSLASGAIAGGAVAIGAAIGLETLPFALVTGAIVVAGWLRGDGARQVGFGCAVAIGLLVLTPLSPATAVCDTIAPLAPVAVIAAAALAALGRVQRHRLAGLLSAAVILTVASLPALGACASGPYGSVDPLVARLWLAQVAEAQPLFSAPFGEALGYAGLLIAGLTASGWLAWRRGGGWWMLLAYQGTALAITLAQLRGVYVGAVLAVVPVAALLADQRARGRLMATLGLWVVGAGISYPLAAGGLARPRGSATDRQQASCTSPAALASLAALPPGRLMAPIDFGAFAITATRHRLIAAPYHRNNTGNRAMYAFFLGSPANAEQVARVWRIDYVAVCPDSLGVANPSAGSIASGAIPAWLSRRSAPDAVPVIYAVDFAGAHK